MSDPQPDIEAMALALPSEERERLAALLLDSLEDDWVKDVDPATLAEWERRYQELKSGKVKGVPREEFLPHIRRELGWED